MSEAQHEKTVDFYTVGIGASAGGLIALETFFRNMPSDSGLAFVIVQHLSPDFKSLMDELLARYTDMAIHKVVDGIQIEPNAIYLMPARNDMEIRNGRLFVNTTQSNAIFPYHPIDSFFKSLAKSQQNNAIGIVFSGAGSDGTAGVKKIHEEGGLVIVQDEVSARFSSMPHSAISSGVVDYILAPEDMAETLLDFVSGKLVIGTSGELDFEKVTAENAFSYIMALLQRKFNVDFTQYKPPTLIRRIERRMSLLKVKTPEDFVRKLRENEEEELEALYRDMLVDVTHFFRDPEAFEWLAENAVPEIVSRKNDGDQLRVWIAGCASGEEAYSLAILFHNEMMVQQKDIQLKIFATDAHQDSIAFASNGVYEAARIETVPEPLREKYFSLVNEAYKIDKRIRRSIVFAPHNLLEDAVFTKLDFISCRNVLIYFLPEVQKKLLIRFHFGLLPDGVLFLGPSEHLGTLSSEFSTLNRTWRIFTKMSDRRLIDSDQFHRSHGAMFRAESLKRKPLTYREGWEKPLLGQFLPDGFLVNHQLQLIQTFGDVAKYLRFPTGKVDLVVTRLVKEELVTPLRAALHRARQENDAVSFSALQVSMPDGEVMIDLKVSPLREGKQEVMNSTAYYFVSFREIQASDVKGSDEDVNVEMLNEIDFQHVAELERELAFTRESLQATIEELETTNEELQASNEEMLASNEELQSTNEELHSVNEELYTVNTEFQQKNNELIRLYDDIENLQRSSQVLTIFLDKTLNIRHFTPPLAALFDMMPHDVGRPFTHLLPMIQLKEVDFKLLAQNALIGNVSEQMITSLKGTRLFLQVMPYRIDSIDDVQGVVLQFTDVGMLERMSDLIS